MARIQILTDRLTQERYFREPVTGMAFRRTTGGLAWPCEDAPGCAVVLGESRGLDAIYGAERRDVHILEERQSDDPAELIRILEGMTEDWLIKNWATPVYDQRVFMLDDVNQERRKARRPLLRYGDPPGWIGKGEGLLQFYHALVQRRTMSEKTLFLGRDSLCGDEIARLPPEPKPIQRFPSMSALCFALAEIDVDRREKRIRRDNGAYGPADDLGGY